MWIRNPEILDDPVRTTYAPGNGSAGAWTFGRLMEHMAGDDDPGQFIEKFFTQFEEDQTINGIMVPKRVNVPESMTSQVIKPWRAESSKRGLSGLAPELAPFRLLGIVNRMDLRNGGSNGDPLTAGQGRIVFAALEPDYSVAPEFYGPTRITVIFEYELIADDCNDVLQWAKNWNGLNAHDFADDKYKKQLEKIVRRFSGPTSAPGRPNNNAILSVRTNDGAPTSDWEWRSFELDSEDEYLKMTTNDLTPDNQWINTQLLADFLINEEANILMNNYDVPLVYNSANFRTPASKGTGTFFFADDPNINNEARHIVSLKACASCHGPETATGNNFHAQSLRPVNTPTVLSGYLTGIANVLDPYDLKTQRSFHEIKRRTTLFLELLEEDCEVENLVPPVRRGH